MPDFSSFFIGRQKINYNYLVIFFSIGRQFWCFGNRPTYRRWSADDRPIYRPMSYLNEPHIIGRSSLATYHRPMCLPKIGRLQSFGTDLGNRRVVFNVIAPVGRQNDVYRPIKIQKSYRPIVFLNVIALNVPTM